MLSNLISNLVTVKYLLHGYDFSFGFMLDFLFHALLQSLCMMEITACISTKSCIFGLPCQEGFSTLLHSLLKTYCKVVHMIAPYVSLVFMKESCILIVLMLVHCNIIYNIIYALYNVM